MANETDPSVVDTVFADGAGVTDQAGDAAYSARDDYTVSATTMSVVKTSKVISDPLNNTTNPKAIPGAVIEYCIAVSNAAGGSAASNVQVADPLPSTVTYDSGFGIFVSGTVTGGVCNADGTAGGTYESGTTTVRGPLGALAAGDTKTVRFRATIK